VSTGWSRTAMSDKEAVIELVKRLPSDVSLHEIIQQIEFIAAVKEGFDEIDQGKGIPVEDVEKMMDAWLTT
jgi:predicted transcriptional regulator